jgi:cytochrome c biogenesis protein CcmG, thiol:disulfide interchange protein DsbE
VNGTTGWGAFSRVRRHAVRILVILGVGLFLGLLAYGLVTSAPSTRLDESLAGGEAAEAPDFELSVLEEGTLPKSLEPRLTSAMADDRLSLRELRGTPVVLNFWASWCIPCREEAPLLEKGWQRYGPRGILFLGLNMQDLTDDARDFLEEFGITYPTIRDPINDVARDYGATGIPETYFISRQGKVIGHVIGVVSKRQLANGAIAARTGDVMGTEAGGARRPQR